MTNKTSVNKNTDSKQEQRATKKAINEPDKKEVKTTFKTLYKGHAKKLSPKAEGHITFQLIEDDKGVKYLQLLENTSGGVFSKLPVPLQLILSTLEKQQQDKPFKSSIVKDVFTGKGSKSANNTSFMIAVLRAEDIELLISSENSQFLSKLSPNFKAKAKQLLAKKV
ncbi:hypothetical protein NBRC116592_04090 [Colwellia sp. KU-HH00111]|uniref:hypothetical protein n=1 Tax=Colwellia sp. KU-HH00111 TaxID=3127652 RepID=UPI003108F726